MQIKQGDIFLMRFHNFNNHLIFGLRPCIVVSNNVNNTASQTVNIVPLTSRNKKSLPTHVLISGYGLKKPSIALTEQVSTADRSQLIKKISHISDADMQKILKCLGIQLEIA